MSPPRKGDQNPLSPPSFISAKEALRIGVREYNTGDKKQAARALEFAANNGQAIALWKLGRMYCDGDGISKNHLKAFELFTELTNKYSDVSPDSSLAPVISNAFVSLGHYYFSGIDGTYVTKDVERAREMFLYAATYFSNPDAQFDLAKIYLQGIGVEKNKQMAARWLKLAAQKRHYPSKALLGYLLITGDGIKKERTEGFMLMMKARESALDARSLEKDAWIFELCDKAEAVVPEKEKEKVMSYLNKSAE